MTPALMDSASFVCLRQSVHLLCVSLFFFVVVFRPFVQTIKLAQVKVFLQLFQIDIRRDADEADGRSVTLWRRQTDTDTYIYISPHTVISVCKPAAFYKFMEEF